MSLSRALPALLAFMLPISAAVGATEESLESAYAAILRGDYDAGRASVSRMLEEPGAGAQATLVNEWLESYDGVVSSREELRRQTFDWCIEQSKKALSESTPEDNKVYLALSFATQAVAYAADEEQYANSDWIKELRPRVLEEALKRAAARQWTKAHSFYLLLNRINEKDEEVKSLRERAARHARLEIIYEKAEDLERRLKDVNYDLMVRAVKLIDDSYYTDADFKKMAGGALDNLEALCTTTKLYDRIDAAPEFDGVADAVAREYFLGKLTEHRGEIEDDPKFTRKDLLRLFNKIKEANKAAISLPNELLIVEFMEGALGELDNFTSIVWPADAVDFDKMMVGNFVGVGIQLSKDETTSRLKVVTPLENSPALEAGVQPGDLIIRVDGGSTKGWTTERAVREITGPAGTEVTLTMYRTGVGERDFVLKRRQIELTSIRGVKRLDVDHGSAWDFMLDQDAGVAYIRLTNFNPDSLNELQNALASAKAGGMRGLILDLRNNPGGLLDVAVGTVSEFIPKGRVVETKGRRERPQKLDVTGDVDMPDVPLVVLINGHSASASEILSGALKDHDRALILGDRTFGKGSVQRVYGIDRSAFGYGRAKPKARLKLTTALYYLPNGKSPHKLPDAEEWGVDPDWKVVLAPKEFNKVLEGQNKAFIIHNEDDPDAEEDVSEDVLAALKDEEEEDDGEEDLLSDDDIELLRSDPFEAPSVDPQLETALLHLRVKLAANIPWPQRQLAKKAEIVIETP